MRDTVTGIIATDQTEELLVVVSQGKLLCIYPI